MCIALMPLLVNTAPARALPLEIDTRPFVAATFTDNMVLQRGMRIPVWGWTAPGAKVSVQIAGDKQTTTAGSDGAWKVRLKELPVGGPYAMDIVGPQTLHLSNILVGDVWLCSGQSNMEVGINAALNPEQEASHANYPNIRVFKIHNAWSASPQPALGDEGWLAVSPRTVCWFSAVGYFFVRDLHNELKIPIGLIDTDWGGSSAEAWTSEEALAKMPDFADYIQTLRKYRAGERDESYEHQLDAWVERNEPAHADFSATDFDDSSWKEMTLPAFWQQAGLPDAPGTEWTTTSIVWFRRTIEIGDDASGKDAVIHLGYLVDADATYVNGTKIGGGSGTKYNGLGFSPLRDYRIPGSLLHHGKNAIAVRVLNSIWRGGFKGPASQMRLSLGDGSSIDLTGAWKYNQTLRIPLDSKPLPKRPQTGVYACRPTTLFNAMLAPVIPYGITGVIWYQGETNHDRAIQYRTLLPDMIGDWRSRWGQGNFPFYIVQLANFAMWRKEPSEPADATWPELREAQAIVANSVPNSGIVATIDIGETETIHPHNKQEVARRLMLLALAKHYGRKIPYTGPTYRSMKIEGSSIRLFFDHIEGGLQVHGETPTGFAIAGADRRYVWANAKVDGDSVVVSAANVISPVAVRYGWANDPKCNLFNNAALPAVPFRTDDWPLLSTPKK